jgi:iron(III) transport system ATP-binding protein
MYGVIILLQINNLRKTYVTERESVEVLKGVDFTLKQGELYTLLGPSGCGKSTILRSVAGLEHPTGGQILIGDETVYSDEEKINVPVHLRKIGMVFQSYAIWPHMDVFHNVAFPLMHGRQKFSKSEVRSRVEKTLKMVQLDHLIDRPAPLLSGGQQQRVALARALVYEPKLLLLDEPLSNLDAKLRVEMRKELRRLVSEFNITTLFVTHDQAEALALSDRIAVVHNGIISQEGTPSEVYSYPQSVFTAQFVGNSNLVKGNVSKESKKGFYFVDTPIGQLEATSKNILSVGDSVIISIRQETAKIGGAEPSGNQNVIRTKLSHYTFTGENTECVFTTNDEKLDFKFPGMTALEVGNELYLHFEPEQCVIIPENRKEEGPEKVRLTS